MQIRELRGEDHSELILLWEAAELEHKPRGRDAFEMIAREISKDPGLLIGAFEEGKLIGSIIGTFDGRRGWLNRLAVHPAHRRKGIGASLIDEMEYRLKKRGAKLIAIHVYSSNKESIKAFKQSGYEVFEGVIYMSKRESNDI